MICISFCSISCLFYFVDYSLLCKHFLVSYSPTCGVFFCFCYLCFWYHIQKLLPRPIQRSFPFLLSLGAVQFHIANIKGFNSFWVNFCVWYNIKVQFFFYFLHVDIQFYHHHLLKWLSFPHNIFLMLLSKID